MTALREITHVFPMVGMNESSTRLAVGDAIADIRSVAIRVYDIERYINSLKEKVVLSQVISLSICSELLTPLLQVGYTTTNSMYV